MLYVYGYFGEINYDDDDDFSKDYSRLGGASQRPSKDNF